MDGLESKSWRNQFTNTESRGNAILESCFSSFDNFPVESLPIVMLCIVIMHSKSTTANNPSRRSAVIRLVFLYLIKYATTIVDNKLPTTPEKISVMQL